MLSGMSSEENGLFRADWRQQRRQHGADVDRIDWITKAVADFEAGILKIGDTSRVSNDEIVAQAEAYERAVDEALKS